MNNANSTGIVSGCFSALIRHTVFISAFASGGKRENPMSNGMFSSGRTRRSGGKPFPPVHILIVEPAGPTGWSTYCTGAVGEEITPTQMNPVCKKCITALEEHDDFEDVLTELGWPWA